MPFLLLMLLTVLSGFCQEKPADTTLLAFASDTQAPMWVETLWLKQHGNRAATKKLFGELKAHRPAALFLLGDVVNLGSSTKQWKAMDKYIDALREDGVRVHAAMGNHEVMGEGKKGQKKFEKRFPTHVNTGFVEVTDSVAVVLLNSNFGFLTKKEDSLQRAWYKETLSRLDADSSIRFIITGCHHSPFTNSRIVRSSVEVQQRFLPLFFASPKSRLFLSGHSHNFEHYRVSHKDFVVIGGGGGLHQPLREGKGALEDHAHTYKPLFHYLTVRRSGDRLQLTSIRLKEDASGFEEGWKLELGVEKPVL